MSAPDIPKPTWTSNLEFGDIQGNVNENLHFQVLIQAAIQVGIVLDHRHIQLQYVLLIAMISHNGSLQNLFEL